MIIEDKENLKKKKKQKKNIGNKFNRILSHTELENSKYQKYQN